MGSYQRGMLGLTLLLCAAAIVGTARMPRPIGYLMGLSGLAYVVQGIVAGADGFSGTGTLPKLLAFPLDLAWMVWLALTAWRPARPAAHVSRASPA